MLRFEISSEGAFSAILEEALETGIDMLKEADEDDKNAAHADLREMFGKDRLASIATDLLNAHKSDRLYMPTSYHFLVIDRFLKACADIHNDCIHDSGEPLDLEGYLIGRIDAYETIDIFFWDTDYDLNSDVLNKLVASEQDKQAGFDHATFGAVNRMVIHVEDLALKDLGPIDSAISGEDYYYKPGEDYPYLRGEW